MQESNDHDYDSEYRKVAELIMRLQEDSKLLEEFNKNADKVMIESGILSEENRNIIKSGDRRRIENLIIAAKKTCDDHEF
jgi:hypothetical protein